MGIVKDIIVLENSLETMFADLPTMKGLDGETDYSITFGYGDKKALNAFLKLAEKDNQSSPYPLIWLLYPYEELHFKTKSEFENVSLILAVKTNAHMQNKDRLNTTYKGVLNPLFKNIKHLLTKANIVSMENEFKVVKHPNYSDSEEGKESPVVAIWDAMRVSFDLAILPFCYKKVKF